ncbi:hypothetical protein IAU60_006192 [Kwoniella sp. DSM 27419]
MATRSTKVRTTALVVHLLFIFVLLLLTLFLATNIPLLAIHSVSGIMALVYVPATLILNAKGRKTRWDRVRGEVVYLGLQAIVWLAAAISAGISGGPGYCNRALYQSGLQASQYSFNDRLAVTQYCDTMSAVIALSSLHAAAMGLWIWWLVRVVTRVSLDKSEESARDLWKVSTGEIMRRDTREHHYRHYRHERRSEGEDVGSDGRPPTQRTGAVTPYAPGDSPRSPTSDLERGLVGLGSVTAPSQGEGTLMVESGTTPVTRQRTAESERIIAEPEVDHGPYIPPPPYQPHYALRGATTGVGVGATSQGTAPPVPSLGGAVSTSPTASTRRPLPVPPIHASSSTQGHDTMTTTESATSTYDPSTATTTSTFDPNTTGATTNTSLVSPVDQMVDMRQPTEEERLVMQHYTLRRVLDEKEDSKEIIRRALQR